MRRTTLKYFSFCVWLWEQRDASSHCCSTLCWRLFFTANPHWHTENTQKPTLQGKCALMWIWLCVFLHEDAAGGTGNGLDVEAYSSLDGFLPGWMDVCVSVCVCVSVLRWTLSAAPLSRPADFSSVTSGVWGVACGSQWGPTGPAVKARAKKPLPPFGGTHVSICRLFVLRLVPRLFLGW